MMDIVKKNIISIICGVIALAAIVAAFVPLGGMMDELQKKVDGRAQVYSSLNSLYTKDRQLPTVKLEDATAEKLKPFPNEGIIEQGQKVTEAVQKESNAMRDAAVAMNVHKLLIPGSLPNPGQQDQFRFRDEYRRLFTPNPNGQIALSVLMKAGMPPSQELVTKAQTELAEKIKKEKLWYQTDNSPGNAPQVDQMVKEETGKLPDQMRTDIAKNSMVYVSPDTFEVNPRIAGAAAPDPIDIFFAQLSLWVQEDVARAVVDTNKGAANLIEAPVKHLVKVRIPPNYFVLDAATPPGTDPDAALPKAPLHSPTGRICNALYDVVHFDIEVVVDAEQLPKFLRELGHNRFITPLKVDLHAGDAAEAMGRGYMYGDKAVVNAKIQCETLFLRKWTEPLVPLKIKEKLGMAPPAQTAGL